MTYNKTKITLEKVSGITGIVISAVNIFGFIALIVVWHIILMAYMMSIIILMVYNITLVM